MASLLSYGLCQSACSAAAVTCYSAAGFTFGTVAAAAAPQAILVCNSVLSTCMATCAAKFLAEGAAETTATGGIMGPVISVGGLALTAAGAAKWYGIGTESTQDSADAGSTAVTDFPIVAASGSAEAVCPTASAIFPTTAGGHFYNPLSKALAARPTSEASHPIAAAVGSTEKSDHSAANAPHPNTLASDITAAAGGFAASARSSAVAAASYTTSTVQAWWYGIGTTSTKAAADASSTAAAAIPTVAASGSAEAVCPTASAIFPTTATARFYNRLFTASAAHPTSDNFHSIAATAGSAEKINHPTADAPHPTTLSPDRTVAAVGFAEAARPTARAIRPTPAAARFAKATVRPAESVTFPKEAAAAAGVIFLIVVIQCTQLKGARRPRFSSITSMRAI